MKIREWLWNHNTFWNIVVRIQLLEWEWSVGQTRGRDGKVVNEHIILGPFGIIISHPLRVSQHMTDQLNEALYGEGTP